MGFNVCSGRAATQRRGLRNAQQPTVLSRGYPNVTVLRAKGTKEGIQVEVFNVHVFVYVGDGGQQQFMVVVLLPGYFDRVAVTQTQHSEKKQLINLQREWSSV